MAEIRRALISRKLIKIVNEILDILPRLINQSLIESVFPDLFQLPELVSIYKKVYVNAMQS